MIYLITNPFCPYCYGNDRTLENELPDLTDSEIMILPFDLTPDIQKFDDKMYETYRKIFNNEASPYLQSINQNKAKYYRKDNIGPSKNVFLTYYFMLEHNLGLKFYHEVTRKFYEEDFNYSEIDNLAGIVTSLGIKKDEYLEAIKDSRYESMYEENKAMVDEADVENIPSYVIDGDVYPGIKKAIAKIKANR